MVMVLVIKDNYLKLLISLNYGVFLLFICVKTICMEWGPVMLEVVVMWTTTKEEIIYQELRWMG